MLRQALRRGPRGVRRATGVPHLDRRPRRADAAIEAIVENEAAKRELFTRLDVVLPDARFLASNTSSVPIMKLGAGTQNPERVLGLHFFNPVPVLPLVEVVRSIMTGDEAADLRAGHAGQGLHRLAGPRWLRRQRAADPVPALGDPHVRVRLRVQRGHRRGDDQGLRAPMVEAGLLGRKSGRGFFDYSK